MSTYDIFINEYQEYDYNNNGYITFNNFKKANKNLGITTKSINYNFIKNNGFYNFGKVKYIAFSNLIFKLS